jgi:hypothetical protein
VYPVALFWLAGGTWQAKLGAAMAFLSRPSTLFGLTLWLISYCWERLKTPLTFFFFFASRQLSHFDMNSLLPLVGILATRKSTRLT